MNVLTIQLVEVHVRSVQNFSLYRRITILRLIARYSHLCVYCKSSDAINHIMVRSSAEVNRSFLFQNFTLFNDFAVRVVQNIKDLKCPLHQI